MRVVRFFWNFIARKFFSKVITKSATIWNLIFVIGHVYLTWIPTNMGDIKSFLHQYCQKNKKEPVFEVRPTGKYSTCIKMIHCWTIGIICLGPKHRQRFLCEVRVEGFNYVGAGNSTNKKDAQSNAARDFVSFLARQALVDPKDVPADMGSIGSNSVPGEL